MSENEKNNKQSDHGQDKGQNNGKVKDRNFGETKSDQDRIQKGAEITPRPSKPEGPKDGSEKK